MKTAVLNIIGTIQEVGYRTKVIAYAHVLDIKGYIRNLPDTTVEIVAQGTEEALKKFIEKIEIKDEFIKVEYIKVKYTDEFEGFKDFHKIVGPNETDTRLDKAVDQLKEVVTAIKETNKTIQNMNQNMQEGFNKMDHNHIELVNKMDQNNENMNKNHIQLVSEIHGLREDNNERVMSEIQEVKALLNAHLKQS